DQPELRGPADLRLQRRLPVAAGLALVGDADPALRVLIHRSNAGSDGRGDPAVVLSSPRKAHILDPWKTRRPTSSRPSTPASSRAAASTCFRARKSRASATPPPAGCTSCCAAAPSRC